MLTEYTAVVKQQEDWWIGGLDGWKKFLGLIARNTLMSISWKASGLH